MTKCNIYKALSCAHLPLFPENAKGYVPRGWAAEQLTALRVAGEAALAAPAPDTCYSLFRQHAITGNRVGYQTPYYAKRQRLVLFSLLAWQEPSNAAYVQALEDTIWSVCSEPYWCLPAHFLVEENEPLPLQDYATQIDLFAAETGFALAEILQLCAHLLSPVIRQLIEDQLEARIFAPFCNAARYFRFECMTNNWSAVCAGAVGAAAMYCIQDGARLSSILHRAMSCMEVYLSSFGEDGVCVEGVDYWSYGFGFFTCFADLLYKRTNGVIDLFANAKVEAIARSQSLFYIGKGGTISFSDGGEAGRYRMGLSCYLARRYPGSVIPDIAVAAPVLQDTCARYCLALRDFLWYDENAVFGLPKDEMRYAQNAKWFILRRKAVCLAAKGGHNGESHNHNDGGSFFLAKNGVQLLCDFGAGEYDAKYFSEQRYEVFVNASRSHNVPIINGLLQAAGADFACANETASENGFSLDVNGCYACSTLTAFHRAFHVEADGTVTLADRFAFSALGDVTEVFATLGTVTLGNGKAVFARNGEALTLHFDASALTPSLHSETFAGHHGEALTATLLHLSAKPALQTELRFTMQMAEA